MPDVVDIVSHARTLADCIKDSVVWSDITDARRSSYAGASVASHASTSFDLSPWMHALRGFKPTKLRAKSSEASRARAKALALVRVRDATMRDGGRDVWVCLAQLINGDAVTQELRGAVPASVEERFELCKRALESCERQSESKPGPPWSRKRAMYGFLIEQWHTRDDFLIVDVECTENAAGMAEDYEFTVIWKDGATSRLTWSDFKTLQTRVLAHVNASEDEKRFISSLKSAIVVGEIKVKVEDASPVGAAATLAVATMNDEDADVDVVVEPSDADSESVRGTEEQEQEPEGAASDDGARVGTCVDQDALGLAVDAEPTRWPLPMSVVARALNGVRASDSDEHVRDVALVSTAVLGLMRADAVMSLRVRDVEDDIVVDSDGVVRINRKRGGVLERAKSAQVTRDDHHAKVNQSHRLWYAPAQYSVLMRMFIERQQRRGERAVDDIFWNIGRSDEKMPNEKAHDSWASVRLSRAIRRLLRNSEEEKFAKHYSGHSARSGGATACFALGVPKHVIRVLGGWVGKYNTNVNKYIDESAGVTAADEFVFGALRTLPGQQRILSDETTRLASSTRKVQPARDSPARIDEAEPEPEERAIETGEQEEELEEQSKEADDVGVAQDQDMSDAPLDGAGRRWINLTLDGDDAPRDTEMVENANREDAANEGAVDAYARGDSNPDADSRENEHSELQNSRESYEEERRRVMAAVKAAERHAAELKERVERAEAAMARAATKVVDGLPCSKQPDAVPKWPQSIINTTGKDTQWLNGRLYAVKRGTPTFPGAEEVRQYYAVKRGTPIGPDDEEVRRAKPKPKPKSKPKEKTRRETKTPGEVGPFYNCRSFVEMSETPRDNPEDDDEVEDARQDETDLQMLHEFVDFSLEEIDFMASWNVVARRFRVMTNDDIPLLCKSFAKTYAEKLLKDSEFYDKFVYTLTNFFDSGVINRVDVVDVLRFAKRALPVGRRPPTSPPSTRARDYVL